MTDLKCSCSESQYLPVCPECDERVCQGCSAAPAHPRKQSSYWTSSLCVGVTWGYHPSEPRRHCGRLAQLRVSPWVEKEAKKKHTEMLRETKSDRGEPSEQEQGHVRSLPPVLNNDTLSRSVRHSTV